MSRWTEDQQLAINTSGKNIIVSAGAGSGKTAVLTERVGRILKSDVHINELLVLTFTKAAASEMKERIRKYIKKDESLKSELDLVDASYITTFDSFALSVVKKYHYLLNISNDIKVTDGSVILLIKKKILNEVIDKLYESKDSEFLNFIDTFTVKDDKTVINYISNIARSLELIPNLEEVINSLEDSEVFREKIITEYTELVLSKIKELRNVIDDYKHYVDSDYYAKLEESLSTLFEALSIDDFLSCELKLPSLPRGTDEEVKDYRDKVVKPVLNELEKFKNYGNTENIMNSFSNSFRYVGVIKRILLSYFELLNKYKLENEVYDFQDIALFAIKIVKEHSVAREELRNQFKEIMIDEYQDTNDIQETFISYIENDNVYMVGDIKQSIYRFRNANPYIFKNKYDLYSHNNGGFKIDLVKNFRSRSEVLDNINLIFRAIMDDNLGGADYVKSHQMVYGNTTYTEEGLTDNNYNLRVLKYNVNPDYNKEEMEAFIIARDILEKIENKYQIFDKDLKILRDACWNDFSIIMDRTSSFLLYKKIFEYLNIPLTINMDEKLNESNELAILKNGLVMINEINHGRFSTKFKYAFVSLARSFLYQMNDEDILRIFNEKDFKNNMIYQDMKEVAKVVNVSNFKEVVDKFIEVTNYYNKLYLVNVNTSELVLGKLVKLLKDYSSNGQSIEDVINYLEETITEKVDLKYSVGLNSSDSVKIMTIHKSKGLEYHICYFSGLYKSFNIRDLNDSFLYDKNYGIVSPVFNERFGIEETVLKELVKSNYLKEEISEKIRLFYVALTRAKEQMILVSPESYVVDSKSNDGVISDNLRSRYKSIDDMINSVDKLLNKYIEKIDVESYLTKNYLYNKEIVNKFKIDRGALEVVELQIDSEELEEVKYSKRSNKLITKEEDSSRRYGLLVHEVLEYVDFKNFDETLIEDEFIRNKVKKFLSNEIFNNIENSTIYKEYEFATISSYGIIDLLVEYEDYIDIIDYKLKGIDDEAYKKQLAGYREYIENLTSKKVNTYLYSIIDEVILKV